MSVARRRLGRWQVALAMDLANHLRRHPEAKIVCLPSGLPAPWEFVGSPLARHWKRVVASVRYWKANDQIVILYYD